MLLSMLEQYKNTWSDVVSVRYCPNFFWNSDNNNNNLSVSTNKYTYYTNIYFTLSGCYMFRLVLHILLKHIAVLVLSTFPLVLRK